MCLVIALAFASNDLSNKLQTDLENLKLTPDDQSSNKSTEPTSPITPKTNTTPETPNISENDKIFDPIVMKFPDTPERKGEAATKYVNDLLAPLKSGAKEKDPYLSMTGESCARGLGSLYNV